MFVMEDTDSGRMAGVCAIKGAVGLNEPFYNYRIGTLVHSSRELDIFTRMETLYLSNDLTGVDRTVLAVPASRLPLSATTASGCRRAASCSSPSSPTCSPKS